MRTFCKAYGYFAMILHHFYKGRQLLVSLGDKTFQKGSTLTGKVLFTSNRNKFFSLTEFQIRGGIKDNSKTIFLISQ